MTFAAPMKIEAVLTPKEQIRLDFVDGSKHFVLMVKREGKAIGQGPLGGTEVTEYGQHDIVPGVGGDPSGYLVFTAAEGVASDGRKGPASRSIPSVRLATICSTSSLAPLVVDTGPVNSECVATYSEWSSVTTDPTFLQAAW